MRLLLLAFLLFLSAAVAQPALRLQGQLPATSLDLGPYTGYYEDTSTDPMPLSVIQSKPFQPFARKRNERNTFSDRSRMVTWLRFSIQNTHPSDTLRLYHETGVHYLTSVYLHGQVIAQTGRSKWGGLRLHSHARRPFRQEYLLIIPPATRHTYYIQVVDHVLSLMPILSLAWAPVASLETNYDRAVGQYSLVLSMGALLGALLLLSLYALYSWLLTRDRAFLYYLLYTCSAILTGFNSIDNRFGLNWIFPYTTNLHPYFPSELHPALITFFYGLFISRIMEIRSRFPRGYRLVQALLAVLALQAGFSLVEALAGRLLLDTNLFYRYELLPSGGLTLLLTGLVFKSRSPLRGYLLAGMMSLVCFSMLPVLINFSIVQLPPQLDEFVNLIPFWMLVGLALEGFCFAMALAFRGRLVELENRRLQANHARELQTQLARQAEEIGQQNQELERQHLKQLETEFERKLADTEMTALRAQMNPHFIFNCLNSINLYTLQNNSDQASEYLTKFARLIRLVLENSRSELVTLKNELEALSLYMELEAMRFKQKLRFSIQVAPQVDVQYIKIPPLLVQPYAENAIWHGLMHKPSGGSITIEISQPTEELIRIHITDDGVGRTRAAALKSKSAGKHKSFGMQVTADRIRMINQLYQIHTKAQVFDLVDSQGEPCGTKVVLDIPLV